MNGEYLEENIDIASVYLVGKMTREFIKSYNLPMSETPFGYVSYSNVSGSAKCYAASKGISASTFEAFRKFPTETEYESEINVRACTEYATNWFLTLLKSFKNSY